MTARDALPLLLYPALLAPMLPAAASRLTPAPGDLGPPILLLALSAGLSLAAAALGLSLAPLSERLGRNQAGLALSLAAGGAAAATAALTARLSPSLWPLLPTLAAWAAARALSAAALRDGYPDRARYAGLLAAGGALAGIATALYA